MEEVFTFGWQVSKTMFEYAGSLKFAGVPTGKVYLRIT